MNRLFSVLSFLALAGSIAGCSDSPSPRTKADPAPAKEKEKGAVAKGKAEEQTPADSIKLIPLKSAEIVKKIEGTKGVVVVDSWASWCIPCKKEFPNLVKIHEKYGKQGVTCMSVTIDEADKHEAALKFLEKVGASFPNYRDADDEAWLKHWKIEGGIPFVLVFHDGKLVKQFDSEAKWEYEQVIQLVEELVKKKAS